MLIIHYTSPYCIKPGNFPVNLVSQVPFMFQSSEPYINHPEKMSSDMQVTKVKEEPMDAEFEAGDYMIHVKQEPSDVSINLC